MEGSSLPQAKLANKSMPGAGLPWELHEACAIWPDLSPADLRDLSDDIAANGLRDPVTLTPDNLLLDGKNRALACLMAGVDPAATAVVHAGDPWLFSLSKNKHRRHINKDQIALAIARMVATKPVGANQHEGGSNELPSNARLAAEAGVTETAIKSAKTVLKHGTPEEKKAIESGKKGILRKAADRVRSERRQALAPSTPSKSTSKPKAAKPAANPIDDVVREIVAQCADGEWRSLAKTALSVRRAEDAVLKAFKALGKLGVAERKNSEGKHEYWIAGKGDAAKDSRIAELEARVAELEADLDQATAPAKATAPAMAVAR
jgi:hypothetical protein